MKITPPVVRSIACSLIASLVLLTALSCDPYGGLASSPSPSPSATPTPTAPAAPAGLTLSLATKSALYLDWANATGATSYTVYRSTTVDGTYALLGTAVQSSYKDAELTAETSYWYKVSASNAVGESPLSATRQGTTNPASNVDVEFAIPSGWNAGNATSGFFPVTRLFISGNFNGWPSASPVEFVEDEEGVFRLTLDFAAGRAILFKYQICTTGVPDHRWMTTMDGLYTFIEGEFPSEPLLPARSDLSFVDDGFQGINASYDVPTP